MHKRMLQNCWVTIVCQHLELFSISFFSLFYRRKTILRFSDAMKIDELKKGKNIHYNSNGNKVKVNSKV